MQWTTHIKSKRGFFDINLREVVEYRDLIVMFVKRYFTLSYKQTILGPLWLILKPVISAAIYTMVFTGIAHISTDGAPALLFYMTGNAVWTFFASCVTSNAGTFTDNADIFGKVYFPRLVMPISNVVVGAINLLISSVLITITAVVYAVMGKGVHVNPMIVFLPVLILLAGMAGMGVGIIVSSVTTKYRDLTVMVGFGMQLWMYATPVVYPVSQIPQKFRILMMFNPCAPLLEGVRYLCFGMGTIEPVGIIVSTVFSIGVFVFGVLLFNRVEKTFMDVV